MAARWTPQNADDAAAAVTEALAGHVTMELLAGGGRRGLGRPVSAEAVLDLSALTGVITYEPEELVLTLRPATPMAEVEALLAARRQALAFEPPDLGPLWGLAPGGGSVGGAIMAGLGGPRRLTAGGPRDHCLGVAGVNGLGAPFAAGGRVVKNVTGFDLPKLVAGSFGTLCVLTELTLKVLPAPETVETLVLAGLDDEAGVKALAHALGSRAQVSGAAHLPAPVATASVIGAVAGLGGAATVIRIEGVAPSVAARADHLAGALRAAAPITRLARDESIALWKEIADARAFSHDLSTVVWKLSAPPSLGAGLGRPLAAELGGRCFYDWGGGGVWLELPAAADAHEAAVRCRLRAVAGADGLATLIRAPDEVRAKVGAFQPLEPGLQALMERVRAQFDPEALFNPGRMWSR